MATRATVSSRRPLDPPLWRDASRWTPHRSTQRVGLARAPRPTQTPVPRYRHESVAQVCHQRRRLHRSQSLYLLLPGSCPRCVTSTRSVRDSQPAVCRRPSGALEWTNLGRGAGHRVSFPGAFPLSRGHACRTESAAGRYLSCCGRQSPRPRRSARGQGRVGIVRSRESRGTAESAPLAGGREGTLAARRLAGDSLGDCSPYRLSHQVYPR